MTSFNIAVLGLIVAAVALASNLYSIIRGQQWRNTDDGRATGAKIGALERAVTAIETLLKNPPPDAKIGALERAVTAIETRLEALPTSADVARLTTTSENNGDGIRILRAQMTRIEDFMMERGR